MFSLRWKSRVTSLTAQCSTNWPHMNKLDSFKQSFGTKFRKDSFPSQLYKSFINSPKLFRKNHGPPCHDMDEYKNYSLPNTPPTPRSLFPRLVFEGQFSKINANCNFSVKRVVTQILIHHVPPQCLEFHERHNMIMDLRLEDLLHQHPPCWPGFTTPHTMMSWSWTLTLRLEDTVAMVDHLSHPLTHW